MVRRPAGPAVDPEIVLVGGDGPLQAIFPGTPLGPRRLMFRVGRSCGAAVTLR